MSELDKEYALVIKGIEPELVWSQGQVFVSRITSNLWMIDTVDDDEGLAAAFGYLSGKRIVPEHFDKWWSDAYTPGRVRITILTKEADRVRDD